MAVSKAGGPDNVPQKVLKEFAYELSSPVTDIINTSLQQGIVPSQWKNANVIPLPKQTPPSVNKLRPVSLTSSLAKIAEGRVSKFVVESIQPYVDERQYGNQKGMSTTHCLIDVYHQLVSEAEKSNNISTLVLTDFSKAFDVIDHNIAFSNLLSMGVSPSIVQWVVDFISGRKQRVKYKDSYSDWLTLLGGVPQGTILAPIIFLSIINSAQEGDRNTDIHVWKYVDDLTLGESRSYGNPGEIQKSLDSLHQWTIENKLKLNPLKCQVMQVYFGRKPTPDVDVRISDKKLAVVNKVKLLGVIIEKDLKWEGQVDAMYCKANKKLFMMRKLKEAGLDRAELLTVYKGYIRPCLQYGMLALPRSRCTASRRSRNVSVVTSCPGIIHHIPRPWLLSSWTHSWSDEIKYVESLPQKLAPLRDSRGGSPHLSTGQLSNCVTNSSIILSSAKKYSPYPTSPAF